MSPYTESEREMLDKEINTAVSFAKKIKSNLNSKKPNYDLMFKHRMQLMYTVASAQQICDFHFNGDRECRKLLLETVAEVEEQIEELMKKKCK